MTTVRDENRALKELEPLIRGACKDSNVAPTVGRDRDDLLQEARIAGLKAIRSYSEGKDSSLETWVYSYIVSSIRTGDRVGGGIHCPGGVRRAQPFVSEAENQLHAEGACVTYDSVRERAMSLAVGHYVGYYTEESPESSTRAVEKRARRRVVHCGISAALDGIHMWKPLMDGISSYDPAVHCHRAADDHSSGDETLSAVDMAVGDMADCESAVFRSMTSLGHRATLREISDDSGVSIGSVRETKKRVMRILRERVGNS